MRTKWALSVAVVALVSVASATGWGDYIFNGSTAAYIVGEDGTGNMINPPGSSARMVNDTQANAAWLLSAGTQTVVSGKNYLAMATSASSAWGSTTVVGIQGDTGTWATNAIQLTGARENLSLVVYNNDSQNHVFNVTVNNIIIPGVDPAGPPDSPHWLDADSYANGDTGALVTEATVDLAAGGSATLTWDLFANASYTAYPTLGHGNGNNTPRTVAPVVGDWLNQVGVHVDNVNALITDVQLTGATATPEPATMMLLGTGLLGGFGIMRRRWMK